MKIELYPTAIIAIWYLLRFIFIFGVLAENPKYTIFAFVLQYAWANFCMRICEESED
tara:strand:+ start:1004 stop:1174 length:171 start_codon:yes stop_codon:yes gene_type:complete